MKIFNAKKESLHLLQNSDGKAAFEFCGKNNIRLSIILPTGLYGDAIMPEHMKHNPFSWLKNAIEGGYPAMKRL